MALKAMRTRVTRDDGGPLTDSSSRRVVYTRWGEKAMLNYELLNYELNYEWEEWGLG